MDLAQICTRIRLDQFKNTSRADFLYFSSPNRMVVAPFYQRSPSLKWEATEVDV